MKSIKSIKGGVVLALVSGVLFFAFTLKSDLSGEYTFNEGKSNFGDSQFRFAWQTMKFTQTKDALTIDRHGDFQGTPTDQKITLKLNGEETENPFFGDNVQKSKAEWSSDGNSLVVNSTAEADFGGDKSTFTTKETYSVDAAAKTLTIVSEVNSNFGDMKTTLVYDKK